MTKPLKARWVSFNTDDEGEDLHPKMVGFILSIVTLYQIVKDIQEEGWCHISPADKGLDVGDVYFDVRCLEKDIDMLILTGYLGLPNMVDGKARGQFVQEICRYLIVLDKNVLS